MSVRYVLKAGFGVLVLILLLTTLIAQPWKSKSMVISANTPTGAVIEVWEKPYWDTNYSWLVIKSEAQEERWFLIDEYIQLTHVVVFISADGKKIRVEDKRIGSPKPDIVNVAEYDFATNAFRAVAEETVEGKEGWVVLKERRLRD